METLVRKKSAIRMAMEIADDGARRRLADALGAAAGDQAEVAAEEGDDGAEERASCTCR